MKTELIRSICLLGALSAHLAFVLPAHAQQVPVESQSFDEFKVGETQREFGRLTFVGGIEMTTLGGVLGAWSSIRLDDDHRHFLGVADTGHWLKGEIERDSTGKLSGIKGLEIISMTDKSGKTDSQKWRMDAEGLALRNNEVLVSFEQLHRVDAYPAPGFETSRPTRGLSILIPQARLEGNSGLETLVVAPKDGPLSGSPVVIAEESLNKDGDAYAAVLQGPRKGIFFVKRKVPFDVTDGTFLPNGDLLLLERRFSFTGGLGMRLRLVKQADIKPGAQVDGEDLLEAGFGYQIDNMEGIDSFADANGVTHIIMVSDDNHSLLQRNLMLEFLLDAPK